METVGSTLVPSSVGASEGVVNFYWNNAHV